LDSEQAASYEPKRCKFYFIFILTGTSPISSTHRTHQQRKTVTSIIFFSFLFHFAAIKEMQRIMSSCLNKTSQGWSFEVTGKVQGVFFRKFTIVKATELGLAGWVRNTHRGTVEGAFAGPAGSPVNEMRHWLLHEGSPYSNIEKTTFSVLTPEEVELLINTHSFVKKPTT
jgi:acylphosphatase